MRWFPNYLYNDFPAIAIGIKDSEDIVMFKLKYQNLIQDKQSYAK
jgi:hypothetical protein